jgi:hypothetical protein
MNRLLLIGLLALGCDDPEVAAKATSILEHGIVDAQASCSVTWSLPWAGIGLTQFSVQNLVDGSKFYTGPNSTFVPPTRLCARSEACGAAAERTLEVVQNHTNVLTYKWSDGLFTIVADGGDVLTYESHTPQTYVSEDITDVCTGFNLEAFGVE